MPDDTQRKKREQTPAKWGASTAKFLAGLEGELIDIHTRSGETLTGILTGVDVYDIFIEKGGKPLGSPRGKTVLVSKHAVDWIEPAADRSAA